MFTQGGQCGLKPQEVLDMTVAQFNAYTKGYEQRILNEQCNSAEIGWWCAYFSRSKRPKSIKSVIQSILGKKQEHSDHVDVDTFMQLEEKRMHMLEQHKGGN